MVFHILEKIQYKKYVASETCLKIPSSNCIDSRRKALWSNELVLSKELANERLCMVVIIFKTHEKMSKTVDRILRFSLCQHWHRIKIIDPINCQSKKNNARNCTKRSNKIQIRVIMIIKPDDLCSPGCYVHTMMKLVKLA